MEIAPGGSFAYRPLMLVLGVLRGIDLGLRGFVGHVNPSIARKPLGFQTRSLAFATQLFGLHARDFGFQMVVSRTGGDQQSVDRADLVWVKVDSAVMRAVKRDCLQFVPYDYRQS